MVATASEAASFHYATEVHATICSTNELEILILEQAACPRSPTAATGRSSQQAESRSSCPSASPGAVRCTVSICHAGRPVPAASVWTATSCLQQYVRWTPTGCPTAIPDPFVELRTSNGPRTSSNSADATSPLWPATKSLCTSGH